MTTIKNTIKKAKTKTHKNTSYPGFILWEGFSPFDGAPIVAIATMKSVNEKTGNQVQTFIIRTDMKPADAVDQGLMVQCVGIVLFLAVVAVTFQSGKHRGPFMKHIKRVIIKRLDLVKLP